VHMRSLYYLIVLSLVIHVYTKLDPKTLLEFANQQVIQTTNQLLNSTQLGTRYPSNSNTVGNKDEWMITTSSAWTSGFYSAILWKLFNHTHDDILKKYALLSTEGLRSQQFDTATHDVGFIMFYSFGFGYQITKDPDYLKVILTAAHSLSTRYDPMVGCIRSWNGEHFQVIIDNMLNLELLFWASQNGGLTNYFDMAVNHSDHMIRDCIKPDGSSYHLVDYDPNTGAVLSKSNVPQGYPNGVWSRGNAWALIGFVKAYNYSKYDRYLNTAILIADYFISQLPADFVPLWDFHAPPNLPQRDTSAASIAASGLIFLSTLVPSTQSQKYFDAATNILSSLGTPAYLGNPAMTNAMLLHGCIGYGTPCDVALIYGDYYFVEALLYYESIVTDIVKN